MTDKLCGDADQLIADLDAAISGPCQIPCDTPEVPGCRCGALMMRVEAALRAAAPRKAPVTLELLNRLQAAAEPYDSACADAVIPAAMWREFVDAHAESLYESAHPAKPSPDAREIPPELYDGMAVYVALGTEKTQTIRPHMVSDVLDAVVRLIRKRQKTSLPAGGENKEKDEPGRTVAGRDAHVDKIMRGRD